MGKVAPGVRRPTRTTPADPHNNLLPHDKPSLVRRARRSLARFVITMCIGIPATLAWQSYGGEAKQIIASWARQQGWSSTPLQAVMNPPQSLENSGEQHPRIAGEFNAFERGSASVPSQAAAVASIAPSLAFSPSAELLQLETIARDLSAMQQNVEKLTAGQEQMTRDLATVQTAQQEIQSKISALPPRPVAPASKPVPRPAQAAPPAATDAALVTAGPLGASATTVVATNPEVALGAAGSRGLGSGIRQALQEEALVGCLENAFFGLNGCVQ